MLRVVHNRVPKPTIELRTGNKPWFDDQCVLTHREKQRAYFGWSRIQADWEGYMVARRQAQHVFVEAEQALNERSRVLLMNAQSPRKWWATDKVGLCCEL